MLCCLVMYICIYVNGTGTSLVVIGIVGGKQTNKQTNSNERRHVIIGAFVSTPAGFIIIILDFRSRKTNGTNYRQHTHTHRVHIERELLLLMVSEKSVWVNAAGAKINKEEDEFNWSVRVDGVVTKCKKQREDKAKKIYIWPPLSVNKKREPESDVKYNGMDKK